MYEDFLQNQLTGMDFACCSEHTMSEVIPLQGEKIRKDKVKADAEELSSTAIANRQQSAEAEIPAGPSKNQDKRARG